MIECCSHLGRALMLASDVRVKSNLLSLKASRLNQALARFVREVRRPNGERYAPDSILYLCLSIQKVRCQLQVVCVRPLTHFCVCVCVF